MKGRFIFAPTGSGKTKFIRELQERWIGIYLDGDDVLKDANISNKHMYWYPNTEIGYSANRQLIIKCLIKKMNEGYNILYSPNPEIFLNEFKLYENYTYESLLERIIVINIPSIYRYNQLIERNEYIPDTKLFQLEEETYIRFINTNKITVFNDFLKLTPLRIAVNGVARAGKDTIGEYLVKTNNFVHISFAKPLYDILFVAQTICNFPQEKDRQFLQYIGTEWARSKNPDIWVELAIETIYKNHEFDDIIITDLRFLNELKALKNHGFLITKVIRDEASTDDTFGNGSRQHSSELELQSLALSQFDIVFNNNGTFNELFCQIENNIDTYGGKRIYNTDHQYEISILPFINMSKSRPKSVYDYINRKCFDCGYEITDVDNINGVCRKCYEL